MTQESRDLGSSPGFLLLTCYMVLGSCLLSVDLTSKIKRLKTTTKHMKWIFETKLRGLDFMACRISCSPSWSMTAFPNTSPKCWGQTISFFPPLPSLHCLIPRTNPVLMYSQDQFNVPCIQSVKHVFIVHGEMWLMFNHCVGLFYSGFQGKLTDKMLSCDCSSKASNYREHN